MAEPDADSQPIPVPPVRQQPQTLTKSLPVGGEKILRPVEPTGQT